MNYQKSFVPKWSCKGDNPTNLTLDNIDIQCAKVNQNHFKGIENCNLTYSLKKSDHLVEEISYDDNDNQGLASIFAVVFLIFLFVIICSVIRKSCLKCCGFNRTHTTTIIIRSWIVDLVITILLVLLKWFI